jgi:DNA-binding MarR family transcriptional regulator
MMAKQDDAPLDRPLGSAIEFLQRLWQLNHALELLSSRMEKRFSVTAQQRLIIRCIGTCPGIAPGQLAGLLHVDPGTVSASLHRLEEKGLLVRGRDALDKRRASLSLTPKGCALDRPIQGTVEDAVARLLDTTRAGEIAATMKVIGKLSELLGDQLRE